MRVRAKAKGFNSGARRVPGEVFEHDGKTVPKNCERVSDKTPLGKPGQQVDDAPQFKKVRGEYVNTDQRQSADAFKSTDPVDPPDAPDGKKAPDDGSDLT